MSEETTTTTIAQPPRREELTAPVPPLVIGPHSFWPPIFPAPMCGISDRPWRQFAREQGCPLVYTQMVSCEAMMRNGRDKSWQILDMFVEPGVVCAQVFGADPVNLADTARRLQDAGAAIVDLNMGCPVNKVVKANGGSALMRQPELVRGIFQKMRAALTVPFTVKFRAGWEKYGEEAFTIAQLAQDEGLDAIAIHARTRQQGFKGHADWSIIRALKERITIPVIGNGDVKSADDAVRMVRDFRADGIMIGRSCMGNPWLFREIAARFRGEPDPPKPTVDERLDAVLRHADMMVMRKGEALGLREFRKHVVSYMKAFPFARELKTKLMDAVTLEEYHTIINDGRDAIRTKAEADANRPKYEGDECEPTDCGCDD
ncbi:MAG TPA: tRNA dihydrouridine synthase DusB [Candidatus Sumerlaeota bacterium]|nr:tRNA dihydrouridine synthase DusB [Candidatus Sumerlaeota bacterium]HMX61455.1 tRNA dihydrouridine synthase DusB [Candidatus Sumerlaeota bacterium]HNM47094.1 tRNA dihydrouridine synthase DusB [Candidatus Sumerlaeota bacterium]